MEDGKVSLRRTEGFRHAHPCLAAGKKGAPAILIPDVPDSVLAFRRSLQDDSVTVYANLSSVPADVVIGEKTLTLEPWGWKIL